MATTMIESRSELSNDGHPTAFISYSWDCESHKQWVRDFASRLRKDGVEARLDRWDIVPGDLLPEYMELSIRDNKFVVVVCTPGYKNRSDSRQGGVGYEGTIITGEMMNHGDPRKFIPVLRDGTWREAAPSWLLGKYYIDLSGNPYDEDNYAKLVQALFQIREIPPPIGPAPSVLSQSAKSEMDSIKPEFNLKISTVPERPLFELSAELTSSYLITAFGLRIRNESGLAAKECYATIINVDELTKYRPLYRDDGSTTTWYDDFDIGIVTRDLPRPLIWPDTPIGNSLPPYGEAVVDVFHYTPGDERPVKLKTPPTGDMHDLEDGGKVFAIVVTAESDRGASINYCICRYVPHVQDDNKWSLMCTGPHHPSLKDYQSFEEPTG